MKLSGADADDISGEVYGKYCSGVTYMGMDYSIVDMKDGGYGSPRWGAIPSPRHRDRRPWRGHLVEWLRRLHGLRE